MSKALTKERIEAQLRETLVKQLGLPPAKVVPSASFQEDLGVDSLDVVDLMFEIEKQFDIVVPDTDVIGLVTVGDLVNYLAQKLTSQPVAKEGMQASEGTS